MAHRPSPAGLVRRFQVTKSEDRQHDLPSSILQHFHRTDFMCQVCGEIIECFCNFTGYVNMRCKHCQGYTMQCDNRLVGSLRGDQ
jgi:hypothetical protein